MAPILLLLAINLAVLPLPSAAQPSLVIDTYEGKPCPTNRECDSPNTLMQCDALGGGPYLCKCVPFRLVPNNSTQPYYSKEAGHCVIREGQVCARAGSGGTWEKYTCEPNAKCETHEGVQDPERYGVCTSEAAPSSSSGLPAVLSLAVTTILIKFFKQRV